MSEPSNIQKVLGNLFSCLRLVKCNSQCCHKKSKSKKKEKDGSIDYISENETGCCSFGFNESKSSPDGSVAPPPTPTP